MSFENLSAWLDQPRRAKLREALAAYPLGFTHGTPEDYLDCAEVDCPRAARALYGAWCEYLEHAEAAGLGGNLWCRDFVWHVLHQIFPADERMITRCRRLSRTSPYMRGRQFLDRHRPAPPASSPAPAENGRA